MQEIQKDFHGHNTHAVLICNTKDHRMVRASLSIIPRKGELLFTMSKSGRKAFQVENVLYDVHGGTHGNNVEIGTITLKVIPVEFDFDSAEVYGEWKMVSGQDVTLSEL